MTKLLTLLLPVALLAGCGSHVPVMPGQSAAEVRASLGAPSDVRKDRNGDELWEFAGGPEGHETHLVRIGADGKVKEVTQIVSQERLMTLVPGRTTKQEVRDLLGRPAEQKMTGVGETWSWRTVADGGLRGHLFVSFNPDSTVRERGALIDVINYDSSP